MAAISYCFINHNNQLHYYMHFYTVLSWGGCVKLVSVNIVNMQVFQCPFVVTKYFCETVISSNLLFNIEKEMSCKTFL